MEDITGVYLTGSIPNINETCEYIEAFALNLDGEAEWFYYKLEGDEFSHTAGHKGSWRFDGKNLTIEINKLDQVITEEFLKKGNIFVNKDYPERILTRK